MLVIQPEEMFVVVVLSGNIATIDSPVINMVIITRFKRYFWIGHVLIFFRYVKIPKVSKTFGI
jgi:hypothetical protein